MIDVIIYVLIGLNVFQIIYWSRQVHKLIDKLMSRNYADYAYVNKPEPALPPTQAIQLNEDDDLDMLNRSMAGLV